MLRQALSILFLLATGAIAFGETKILVSPYRRVRASIIAVGTESRVEIRSASGTLVASKDFTSRDHSHGEVVSHAQWTNDGRFFVFTTGSSGGHQPWHVATYFYSARRNRFCGVDSIVGTILSDFTLHGDVLATTRMGVNADDPKPVTLSLTRWR